MTCSKELKTDERGKYEVFVTGGLVLVNRNDNKLVFVMLNFESIFPLRSIKRWSKKHKKTTDIDMPLMISSYNSFMGAVDLLDRYISDYRPTLRSRKWW